MGTPLKEGSKPVDVSKLKPDAVLVSHPHQDHYGLVASMDRDIPVYISELGKNLIDAACIFSRRELLLNVFRFIEPWEPFEVGVFTVTPYLMDHSAPDAFGFLIEAGGKRLFYSGDFRAHGRKGVLFERFIQEPPVDIDVLLMEGTMLCRSNGGFPDESSVEEEIVRVIADQHNASFIVCASQNIDRIVSAFRACKRTGKTLVVDVYTEWVLERMKLVSDSVPNMYWDEVKVFVPNSQYQVVKGNMEFFGDLRNAIFEPDHRITAEELQSSAADYVQIIRLSGAKLINRYIGDEPVNIIYSDWPGYLEEGEERYGASELVLLRDDPLVNFVYAYTGGHAMLEDLKLFARTLSPKILVPVHTDYPDEFQNNFDHVLVLRDGQELTI